MKEQRLIKILADYSEFIFSEIHPCDQTVTSEKNSEQLSQLKMTIHSQHLLCSDQI